MGILKDAVKTMKDVALIYDKLERVGSEMSEASKALIEHDKRIMKMEMAWVFYSRNPNILSIGNNDSENN